MRHDLIFWMLGCYGAWWSERILRMTSAARYIVHLVLRRHVDFGMTRSMMCMPA